MHRSDEVQRLRDQCSVTQNGIKTAVNICIQGYTSVLLSTNNNVFTVARCPFFNPKIKEQVVVFNGRSMYSRLLSKHHTPRVATLGRL